MQNIVGVLPSWRIFSQTHSLQSVSHLPLSLSLPLSAALIADSTVAGGREGGSRTAVAAAGLPVAQALLVAAVVAAVVRTCLSFLCCLLCDTLCDCDT